MSDTKHENSSETISSDSQSQECTICMGNGVKCSDTKTLNIIQEFKQLYENKMKIIEAEGAGDCNLQAKISLQHDWIRDLTEQNDMLVKAVESLEQEATERVLSLEERLKHSSKCACEVMNTYKDMSTNLEVTFQQMTRMQEDVQNLIEFIRRIREDSNWNLDGLHFYTINQYQLLGHLPQINIKNKSSEEMVHKDARIKELERQLKILSEQSSRGDGKTTAEFESLKQAMLDMRGALTAEVADKHDTILNMKREVQMLEEQCRKADQQTHFKDDIIKELRKEMKQLKAETKVTLRDFGVQTNLKSSENLISTLRKICHQISIKLSEDNLSYTTCRSCGNVEKTGQKQLTILDQDDKLDKTLESGEGISHKVPKPLKKSKLPKRIKLNDKCLKDLDKQIDSFKDSSKFVNPVTVAKNEARRLNKAVQMKPTTSKRSLLTYNPDFKKEDTSGTIHNYQYVICDNLIYKTSGPIVLNDNPDTSTNDKIHSRGRGEVPSNSNRTERIIYVNNDNNKTIDKYSTDHYSKFAQQFQMSLNEEEKLHLNSDFMQDELSKSGLIRYMFLDLAFITVQEKVDLLLKDLYEKDKRISDLEDTVQEQFDKIVIYMYVMQSMAMKIQAAKQVSDDSLHDLEIENMDLRSAIKKASEELQGFEKLMQKAQQENKEKITCLECDKDNMCKEMDRLIDQHNCLTQKNIEKICEYEKKYCECMDTIEQLTDELNKTKNEHSRTIKSVSELKEKNGQYCCTIDSLKMSLAHAETRPASPTVQVAHKKSNANHKKPELKNIGTCTCVEVNSVGLNTTTPHIKDKFTLTEPEVTIVKAPAFTSENTFGDSTQELCKRRTHFKDQTEELEYAVHDLNFSVSRMMTREFEADGAKQRIRILEEQLEINNRNDDDNLNDTILTNDNELQAWKAKETEIESARYCREREICNLKAIIDNLVHNLENEKQRSENLEKAVALYLNSISVLETSEEQLKKEIGEQKITIFNLQEAVVAAKHNLDDMHQQAHQEIIQKNVTVDNLWSIIHQADRQTCYLLQQCDKFTKLIEKLRDENLELEVDLFYNFQDLEIYETRVLKYQHICKELQNQYFQLKQDCDCMQTERRDQTAFVDDLTTQLADCQEELKHLFSVLSDEQNIMEHESINLTNHIMALQSELCNLSQQLALSLQALQHEKQLTNKLEISLNKKDCDISSLQSELIIANEKLRCANCAIVTEKEKVDHLNLTVSNFNESIQMLDKESTVCQANINYYMECLKETQDELNAKIAEFDDLNAAYQTTLHTLQHAQAELQTCRNRLNVQSTEYEQTINSLDSKYSDIEQRCQCYCDELTQTKEKIKNLMDNEMKIKQEYTMRENSYLDKFNKEETKLLTIIANMENHSKDLTHEIGIKNMQINELKANLQGMKESIINMQNNSMDHIQMQEEICNLKNEINSLIQTQDILQEEKDQLQNQIHQMHNKLGKSDEKSQIIVEELEQCLRDIQTMQRDKEFLMQKNEQLTQEIQSLQDACQSKTESFVTLELELNDTKCVRDSLCNESRNVINNVKVWLHEQRKINMELSKKIKNKNTVISNLNDEIHILKQQLAIECPYTEPPSHSRKRNSDNVYWSLSSAGSRSASSSASNSDWEHNVNNDTPQVWIHRVESLTEELQKNNKLWKNKSPFDKDYLVSRDK